MRTSSTQHRSNRPTKEIPWGIILWLTAVIIILVVAKLFRWDEMEWWTGEYLSVEPIGSSIVYMASNEWSKTRMQVWEKFYADGKSIFVENQDDFSAKAENSYIFAVLDKGSELSYLSQSASSGSVGLIKGRAWIEVKNVPMNIELKSFSINGVPGNVFFLEQNNVYSTVYALKWTMSLATKIGNYSLNPGEKIMLRASDLTEWNDITKFIGEIDESILSSTIFKNQWGETLLKNIQTTPGNSWSGGENSLAATGSENTTDYIRITEPTNGSVIKDSRLTVMWEILSKDVKRVTINNRDASVSPVNETFVLQDFEVSGDIIDIVYKAYNDQWSLLQSKVITVFGSKTSQTNQKLVPENFPLNNKDFQITSPSENPYKTTENLVKVQWTVPRNTVQYIVVNDYRLQKFIPNSSTWYYFANTDTDTMKEGINIYSIKFYNSDNKLLYTQLFTIVKESKNATVSGEMN